MYPYLGDFPTGATIFFPFHTFNSSGASVTLTGLAVTDIEVYKGASMTQRASDAGYALVDTDGIDLDGITGIHGFTIDTSDNTDAGFFAAGNDYTVVVSAVTVDGQTVSFIAGRFSIDNRGLLRPTVASRTLDVTAGGNAGIDADNIALTNGAPAFGIQASGTLSGTHSSTTADLGTNAPSQDITGMTLNIPSRGFSRVISSYNTSTGVATWLDATAETLTNADPWYLFGTGLGNGLDAAGIRSAIGMASADLDTQLGTLATSAEITALNDLDAAGVRSALGMASANLDTQLAAIAAYLDTEIAAILADTAELQGDWVNGGRLDLLLDAIKAKTDQLVFTVANRVDANTKSINDVALTGDGQSGTEFSV